MVSEPMANRRLAQGFRLIEKCGAGLEVGPLVAEFLATIALFGFNAVACGGWVSVGTSLTPAPG
jgi:hypothetical protein